MGIEEEINEIILVASEYKNLPFVIRHGQTNTTGCFLREASNNVWLICYNKKGNMRLQNESVWDYFQKCLEVRNVILYWDRKFSLSLFLILFVIFTQILSRLPQIRLHFLFIYIFCTPLNNVIKYIIILLPLDKRSTLSILPSTLDLSESKSNGAKPWSTLLDLLLREKEKDQVWLKDKMQKYSP